MNIHFLKPRDLGAMAGHSGTGSKELERRFRVEGRVLNTQETFLYTEVTSINPHAEQMLFICLKEAGVPPGLFFCVHECVTHGWTCQVKKEAPRE
jgi:hypothetical protein